MQARAQTAPRNAARPGLPNILFIMADQVTPFMISPYGCAAAKTPNLARLAREGTIFENAYCPSPLCVPSRSSMWSGRLPTAITSFDNGSEFFAHLPTIPYLLRTAGYRTAVSGKCHFIGPDQLHGFDERLTPCIFPAGFSMTPNWKLGPVYNKGTSIQATMRALGPSKWTKQLGFDQYAFEQGLARLQQHAAARDPEPLCLTVSFTQPHDPFTTTKEFLDLYNGVDIPMPKDYGDIRRLSPTYEWFIIHHGLNREKLSPEQIREARRNYLGMISWVDSRIGMLLDELDRLGLAANTAVVFTSDHGEMMGEHGQWSKRLLLEWSARVPLIVRLPGGARPPARITQPVSTLDLLPTFNDLAGAKTDLPFDGTSLLPLLRGGAENPNASVICEYLGEGTIEPERMLRSGRHKYIIVNGYGPQLFDLKEDPNETVNLAGRSEYRAVEAELAKKIGVGWDGPALKRTAITDQQQRLLIQSLAKSTPRWDYVVHTPGPYLRDAGVRDTIR